MLRLIIAVGLLAGLTITHIQDAGTLPTGVQLLLLFGAAVVMAFGSRTQSAARRTITAYATPVLIVLLAFALRVVNLDSAIQRHVDELPAIRSLVELQDNPHTALLVPYDGVAAFPRVYSYLQMQAVAVFGPTLTGLRIISAILGTLTVAALYRLAGVLFDRRTALLAAVMLAVFPPHIHFSRIGINNVGDPLFATLALAFIAYGARRSSFHHGTHALTAGVMLGLSGYFYEGGRLLYPPLLLLFGALIGMRLRVWLAFAAGAILFTAPLYLTWAAGGYAFAPRLESTALSDISTAWTPLDVLRTLGVYLIQPDSGWFYTGRLIPVFVLPFFLIGVGLALWHSIRRGWPAAGMRLILLWLLAAALGNSLLRDPFQTQRYVVAMPAVALAVALGVNQVAVWFAHLPSSDRGRWLQPVMYLSAVLAILQIGWYFGVHTAAYMRAYPEQVYIDDIYFRSADLPDNTHVQIMTDILFVYEDAYYFMRFKQRHEDNVFFSTLPTFDMTLVQATDNLLPGRNFAFFIPPEQNGTLALLDANPYLEGPYTNHNPPEGRYVMYFAPKELRFE